MGDPGYLGIESDNKSPLAFETFEIETTQKNAQTSGKSNVNPSECDGKCVSDYEFQECDLEKQVPTDSTSVWKSSLMKWWKIIAVVAAVIVAVVAVIVWKFCSKGKGIWSRCNLR